MAAALIVFVDALPRTANENYCARRCACWMVCPQPNPVASEPRRGFFRRRAAHAV